MNCPFCGTGDTRVVNSRPSPAGDFVRRRRECQACAKRFTTVEYIEKVEMMVVKRNGEREPFQLQKIRVGLERAFEKRPVPPEAIDRVTREVEREVLQSADREVDSETIGRVILREIKKLDHVAYVRFASVYKQFHDLQDFNAEIQSLLKE
ncbi:MAG: transcriptional regulator NrdR [Candidatus Sumerlaeia bacterium]|nr:transcriptional regulator NrdR [Candidatus Sumerlaeia bacterium]